MNDLRLSLSRSLILSVLAILFLAAFSTFALQSGCPATSGSPCLLQTQSDSVNVVKFGNGGTLVAGLNGGNIAVWDSDAGSLVRQEQIHSGDVAGLAFQPFNRTIVTGSRSNADAVGIYQVLLCCNLLRTFRTARRPVEFVETDSQGIAAFAGYSENSIDVLNLEEGQLLITFEGSGRLISMHYEPTFNLLAAIHSDGNLRVWSVPDRTIIYQKQVQVSFSTDGREASVEFSRDGSTLALGECTGTREGNCTDGAVRTFDALTGDPITRLAGHSGAVSAVAFHPTRNHLLAAVSHSGGVQDIKIWDLQSESASAQFEENGAAVLDIEYSADGNRLAIASRSSTITVLKVGS